MCFDSDSRPPIPPVAGAAVGHERLTLTANDGNRFAAFEARASAEDAPRAAMLILPDVRGLHRYYEELALRFAEAGIDALAIDYFGRTASSSERGEGFDYVAHVAHTSYAGLRADVAAGADRLRDGRARALFTVGFYGWPVGASRGDVPTPADRAGQNRAPVLAIFGGADAGIPAEAVGAYETALASAGSAHEIVTYPGAPHSFFDRKQAEHADASADAWRRVLDFVAANASALDSTTAER